MLFVSALLLQTMVIILLITHQSIVKPINEYIKAYYDFDKHCWGIKEQSNPDDKVNFLQIENELKNDIKGEFDNVENWRRA